jgi:hypothetical protein
LAHNPFLRRDAGTPDGDGAMKLLDRVKDMTGVYSTGFDPASAAGFLLPGLFVIIVGGALAAWIHFG